jgi:ABC-type nitrate/sulfonate/bicarbonate transport system substrate-binding protein
MKEHHAVRSSRREFMGRAGLAAAAGLLSMPRAESAAEPPPETTTFRTAHGATMCEAPQSFAEGLRRGEGFTDVRYVATPNVDQELAAGTVDMVLRYAAPLIGLIDDGLPIVVLGGVHVGCIDLFARQEVRSVRELKGRRLATESRSLVVPAIYFLHPSLRTSASIPAEMSTGLTCLSPSGQRASPTTSSMRR